MALGLRVEAPEGQVDAWPSIMVLLRHLVLDKAQRTFLNHQAVDLLTWTVLGWFSSPGTRSFNSLTGSDTGDASGQHSPDSLHKHQQMQKNT